MQFSSGLWIRAVGMCFQSGCRSHQPTTRERKVSNGSVVAIDSNFSEPLRWEPVDVDGGIVVQRRRDGEISEKSASHIF
jgi:hypothetical protein